MAVVTKEVEEYVCDICGLIANGRWNETTYLNDKVYAERYCPIDLCQHHMEVFASHFSHYAHERYDAKKNTDELIKRMKEHELS